MRVNRLLKSFLVELSLLIPIIIFLIAKDGLHRSTFLFNSFLFSFPFSYFLVYLLVRDDHKNIKALLITGLIYIVFITVSVLFFALFNSFYIIMFLFIPDSFLTPLSLLSIFIVNSLLINFILTKFEVRRIYSKK